MLSLLLFVSLLNLVSGFLLVEPSVDAYWISNNTDYNTSYIQNGVVTPIITSINYLRFLKNESDPEDCAIALYLGDENGKDLDWTPTEETYNSPFGPWFNMFEKCQKAVGGYLTQVLGDGHWDVYTGAIPTGNYTMRFLDGNSSETLYTSPVFPIYLTGAPETPPKASNCSIANGTTTWDATLSEEAVNTKPFCPGVDLSEDGKSSASIVSLASLLFSMGLLLLA